MRKEEILRYLRTSSKVNDERLSALIDECIDYALKHITPKTIYRIFDCAVTEDSLIIDDVVFKSKRLAANLAGCKRTVVFGATLGTESDRILRIHESTEIAKASVFQAVFAEMIEDVCDNLEKEIIKENNVSLCKRYSPGYFDLAIENQKTLFELIDITKRTGITLTDTMQMIPTKSVTGFMGIENEN